MNATRRQFTATAAAILSGTAGCVGRRWWRDDTEGDEQNSTPEGNENESSRPDDANSDPDPETGSDPNASAPESEPANGTTDQNDSAPENESSSEPVEDSTRPETVNVDDSVTATIEHDVQRDVGVAVWGTVKNVTDEPIDHVAVTLRLYDANGTVYYEQTDGTIGLEWNLWEFKFVTRNAEHANRYARHEVDVSAQQLE